MAAVGWAGWPLSGIFYPITQPGRWLQGIRAGCSPDVSLGSAFREGRGRLAAVSGLALREIDGGFVAAAYGILALPCGRFARGCRGRARRCSGDGAALSFRVRRGAARRRAGYAAAEHESEFSFARGRQGRQRARLQNRITIAAAGPHDERAGLKAGNTGDAPGPLGVHYQTSFTWKRRASYSPSLYLALRISAD